jgi:hypothetical protein
MDAAKRSARGDMQRHILHYIQSNEPDSTDCAICLELGFQSLRAVNTKE